MSSSYKSFRQLGWNHEEAAMRARVTDAAHAKMRAGQAEWLAKGYHAPLDCAAKILHDKETHGSGQPGPCGCLCDANGNRID
jgi:hypothetical protein